jgi:hypothetical protein
MLVSASNSSKISCFENLLASGDEALKGKHPGSGMDESDELLSMDTFRLNSVRLIGVSGDMMIKFGLRVKLLAL